MKKEELRILKEKVFKCNGVYYITSSKNILFLSRDEFDNNLRKVGFFYNDYNTVLDIQNKIKELTFENDIPEDDSYIAYFLNKDAKDNQMKYIDEWEDRFIIIKGEQKIVLNHDEFEALGTFAANCLNNGEENNTIGFHA